MGAQKRGKDCTAKGKTKEGAVDPDEKWYRADPGGLGGGKGRAPRVA